MKKTGPRPADTRPPENPTRLRERVYQHLQGKLADGGLRAGGTLSEIPLAQELGISRTPVREAIGQLVAEGFLEQIPHRGTVVRQLTQRDIVELYELREALEVYAVGKVAGQPPGRSGRQPLADTIDELERLGRRLGKARTKRLSREAMREFGAIDLAFHTGIVHLAGNARILKVVTETRLLVRIFALPHQAHDAAQLADIRRYHRSILDAIVAGDAPRAQEVLAEHIQVSLRERIDAHGAWEREHRLQRAMSAAGLRGMGGK